MPNLLTQLLASPRLRIYYNEMPLQFTPDQMIFPPPDLAVEVLSPSTEATDRGTKFEDYAAHGATEYWIVDPDARTLEQYILKGDAYELRLKSRDGTVESAAIVGATFSVKSLFEDA